MSSLNDQPKNIDDIKESYIQQRKGGKVTQVVLKLNEDIQESTDYLLGVLSYGDQVQDYVTHNLFDDSSDNEKRNENLDNQIQINENLTGKTLTHFTLDAKDIGLNKCELYELTRFIDLCPNLLYLDLDLQNNYQLRDEDMTQISSKLRSLQKLQILHLKLDFIKFTDIKFNEFSQDISELSNLTEFEFSLNEILPFLKILCERFSKHKKLNKLIIHSKCLDYNDEFIKKTRYLDKNIKRIIRLVSKEIIIKNISYQNINYNINQQDIHQPLEEDDDTEYNLFD